jgi:glycine dehydrogenase
MIFDFESFSTRHIGPDPTERDAMLRATGAASMDALMEEAIPHRIRLPRPLQLPAGQSEYEFLRELRTLAARNQIFKSYLGLGYSDCITPSVILRNVLENPGWYTPYTPYQAEMAQGRLESLLNFQTVVRDLTGMEVANASLLDEATAAAEAMTMLHRVNSKSTKFFVADSCFPQTIDVLRTRAEPLGIELVIGDWRSADLTGTFGALVQTPDESGLVHDLRSFIDQAHSAGALVAVGTDLLSLALLTPPGEMGADVVFGNSQRFGVPLGYGGPHAAFFATREKFVRQVPGRVIGVSVDVHGNTAYRMALQTREQHIRREKATSNICTAQALLANIAGLFAVYHGPKGLTAIARRVHGFAKLLERELAKAGIAQRNEFFFDTLKLEPPAGTLDTIRKAAEKARINLRYRADGTINVALDETTTEADLRAILKVFAKGANAKLRASFSPKGLGEKYPENLARTTAFLTHPIFNTYHSETQMMRYIRNLERKDVGLDTSMIPLGSCTMKLNAAAEMFPVSWPQFAKIHPFAPLKQTRGYQKLFEQLEAWLAEITGFAGISLQPNAGSQGEYAGLLVIRAYHESRGEPHRNVCLIPTSAHGTNPASAVMAGMKVVAVACDTNGNIDVTDLRAKAEAHKADLSALMITYPSTHGVFEETIREICDIIHANGGQVYMDGANMNAQVGLTSPGFIGADVCHLNLHKTFCIPHGGGGPGVGPIGVAEHLVDFLPGHNVINLGGENPIGAVAAAPWGSASILTISWMYIAMMGADGLTEATKFAILNANYIAARLEKYFPTLYRSNGLVAHECILDLRAFHKTTAEDVAKRLMDYGFHAPTLSWPVAGTLMVEPTESESKYELDRFCDAMISIHAEMTAIESGAADAKNNLLKNAPHTADQIASDNWNRPYTREQAAFPAKSLHDYKFWPHVSRVDNVFGDRNPVCSCVGMENYS